MDRIVGIDIGGTKIAIGLFDGSCGLLGQRIIPTEAEAPFATAANRMASIIEQLLYEDGGALCGIGIGCSGPLDIGQGLVSNPYTLPGWKDAPITAYFRNRFGCAVFLENDADVALLGEVQVRSGKSRLRNALMLTFGTGVGGSVLHGGKIFHSEGFGHPEFGHLLVSRDDTECYCGGKGCLEALTSGPAILRQVHALGRSSLQEVADKLDTCPSCVKLVEQWADHVTQALWNLSHLFAPELVILGGGVTDSLPAMALDRINGQLDRGIFHPKPRVEKARLGSQAGMIGAASLILLDR